MVDFKHSFNNAVKPPEKSISRCGPSALKINASSKQTLLLAANRNNNCRKPILVPRNSILVNGTYNRARARVQRLLDLFMKRCEAMKSKKSFILRVDLEVLKEFRKEESMFLNQIGLVPGVKVGDSFQYRAELRIASLHRSLKKGIDYVKYDLLGATTVATCVVATEWNYNNMIHPDVLLYAGEGERRADKVMKCGNLAMSNSIKIKNDVRVIRGLKVGKNVQKIVYIYDGLYHVVGSNCVKGEEGKPLNVFKMRRKPGQHIINWKDRENL